MDEATQAAIEYFAGELPPGWTVWVDESWEDWEGRTGITRRAYAESQCIPRVCEVAKAAGVDHRIGWTSGGVGIEFWDPAGGELSGYRESPSLLLAAHSTCLALETK